MFSSLRSRPRSKRDSRPSASSLATYSVDGQIRSYWAPERSLITIASRLSKFASLTSTPYFSENPRWSAGSMYWAQL